MPRDRQTVAAEFLAAQREAELVIGKCADLRDELRQISLNDRRGFTVDVEGKGSVTVTWNGMGRPQVEAKIDWRKTLTGTVRV